MLRRPVGWVCARKVGGKPVLDDGQDIFEFVLYDYDGIVIFVGRLDSKKVGDGSAAEAMTNGVTIDV